MRTGRRKAPRRTILTQQIVQSALLWRETALCLRNFQGVEHHFSDNLDFLQTDYRSRRRLYALARLEHVRTTTDKLFLDVRFQCNTRRRQLF
jgi:hypothetical protein